MSGQSFEWTLVTTPEPADTLAAPGTEELYGSDLWCEDDIDDLASELPSTNPLIVAQANYRRLSTERGTLIDDPDYGFDLLGLIHHGVTQDFIASIPGQVKNELLKDERNETVECTISNVTARSFDVEIRGTTAEGPFDLVVALDANNVTATLKAMSG
jgi:hypothetical protein